MTCEAGVAVWSTWAVDADAVVAACRVGGVEAWTVADPAPVAGLLVLGASAPGVMELLARRRAEGRSTVIWGGTLPPARVATLRSSGCAAYVSMLQSPTELARIVGQVLRGERVAWPAEPPRMATLTAREEVVARGYLVGSAELSRAEVAAELGLSERTLKVHIANIRAKAGHEGTATREGLHRALALHGWLD
ncbi:MAG: LuxR C-terminal-related transcriptional regulator [Janibacter sp.]